MKSRIEKLGHYEKDGKLFVIKHGEGGARTTLKVEPCKKGETPYALFLTIAEKVDEIIDLLNSQEEERFTKEDLKVLKMSLDGMTANEICTLLDEESFDNTKDKVLSKLNNK